MAVTRASKSVTLTAVNDAAAERMLLESLSLVGTGMTAGQRLTITDNDGSILADHYVEATNENVEFLQSGPKWVQGIKLTAVPAAGTWTVVGRIK